MSVRLILHDIRSCHNVGSLLRTAEGIGVDHVYLTGYTPYPMIDHDSRLPHIRNKITAQIHKTALGAEHMVAWSHHETAADVLKQLSREGYATVALEQAASAIPLPQYRTPERVALLLGREVEGVDPALLELVDQIVEIPMRGSKESFNVVQAAAMALYELTTQRD